MYSKQPKHTSSLRHKRYTGLSLFLAHTPMDPCIQIEYTLAPKYLNRDYIKGQSIYYLGTWTLRVHLTHDNPKPNTPSTLRKTVSAGDPQLVRYSMNGQISCPQCLRRAAWMSALQHWAYLNPKSRSNDGLTLIQRLLLPGVQVRFMVSAV